MKGVKDLINLDYLNDTYWNSRQIAGYIDDKELAWAIGVALK